jgi:hypothetical protein
LTGAEELEMSAAVLVDRERPFQQWNRLIRLSGLQQSLSQRRACG